MAPIQWVALIIFFLILGWLFAGRRIKPRDLLQTIDQLNLERDTQARTIDHQRRYNAEIEKKLDQAERELVQWKENEKIVRMDRGRLQEELNKMALALRELPSEEARQQFNQAYDKANKR